MSRFSRIDWTGSDYDSILTELRARIAATFPDWTDTSIANEGMALIEVVAHLGDLIRYYQDRQVNEAFLATAWERDNIIRHLRGIGYRMTTAAPAKVSLRFTLDKTYSSPVAIPAVEPAFTEDGEIRFETDKAVEIAAGQTQVDVDATEGETIEEALGLGTGLASQRFVLGKTPFIWSSETVTVDGVAWTRVEHFLSSAAADKHYVVEV